jgi:hypothetical protein
MQGHDLVSVNSYWEKSEHCEVIGGTYGGLTLVDSRWMRFTFDFSVMRVKCRLRVHHALRNILRSMKNEPESLTAQLNAQNKCPTVRNV